MQETQHYEGHQYEGHYRAFGLDIHSEVPFMTINGVGKEADVIVRLEKLPTHWLEDDRASAGYVEIDGETIWFVWEGLGVMKINEGRSIIIDPVPGILPSLLNQAVQSAGLGLILHQRQTMTLHASAVEINGGVVAFVGYKGAGKSTTAASLFAQGHQLVTDDLLVMKMDEAENIVSAFPGIPQLRLWPEAVVASLEEDPELLPRNSDLSTKRLRDAGSRFVGRALPLQAIYVLDFHKDDTTEVTVEPVPQRDACIELVRHSYALHYLGNRGASAGHLKQSQLLTSIVPVRRLLRPKDLAGIPKLVEKIESLHADSITT